MTLQNKKEVNTWLFHHAAILGNVCIGIKGIVEGETINIAYYDTTTKEKIDLKWRTK